MDFGVITGTGIESTENDRDWNEIDTPYGTAFIAKTVMGGKEIVLLRRHGPGLNVPPHLINYHANIWALKNLGVRYIITTAAVGSLRRTLHPGSLLIIEDFIDFTKRRNCTIYNSIDESVTHTDFSVPYCPVVSASIQNAALINDIEIKKHGVYICVDGPRYETPSEIRMFAQWGGDVIGMTGVPEVVIAKEMGVCYGTLAIVTNYAAGVIEQKLSHKEVVECVNERRHIILNILDMAIESISDDSHSCE